MPAEPVTPPTKATQFRQTLVRVLAVQVITLLAFWLLQARYTI